MLSIGGLLFNMAPEHSLTVLSNAVHYVLGGGGKDVLEKLPSGIRMLLNMS